MTSRPLIKICLLFIAAWTIVPAALAKEAADTNPEDLYRNAREAFYAQTDNGDAGRDRKAWSGIAGLFQKVYSRFPKSHRSDDALYTEARIFHDLFKKYGNEGDLDSALHLFQKLTVDYPASRLADDAQFKEGEIFIEIKKDPGRALAAFEKIPKLYPEGDKVGEAGQIIASLKKNIPPEPQKKKLVRMDGIRYWSNPSYTRIVIDLPSTLEFKEERLYGPNRLYIDLYDAEIDEGLRDRAILVNDGLIKQIRASQYKPDVVRVVFDVAEFQNFEVFSYENPFRVVMDVRGRATPSKKETISALLPPSSAPSAPAPAPAPIQPPPSTPSAPPLAPTPSKPPLPSKSPAPARSVEKIVKEEKKTVAPALGMTRIVLDAGHGGKDRGATGYSGIEEKDIVLDITLRLKKIILSKEVSEVILTREDDIYIPLEERTAIANTANGDIFISIHGNSAPRKEAFGIETFFLSNALSERALETALRENMAPAKDMSDDLRFILSDMLANSNMKESSELAATVQRNLVDGLKKSYSSIKDLGAKGGPFYVLHGANMPSVLVEVAFLSNPMEAQRIRLPEYREKIAHALYDGIRRYIQEFKFAMKTED